MTRSSNVGRASWAVTLATAISVPLMASAESPRGAARSNGVYIVELADAPVTSYTGNIPGYAATKLRRGQKVDPNSPTVSSYMAYLQSRHDMALARAGGSKKLYSYGYVFNGFAAELTPQQAAQLASQPGVRAVTKDVARSLDTSTTPSFLGLSGPTGYWSRTGAKGENVIIGIVDGGVWPEHPSFSDRTGSNGSNTQDGKLSYQQMPGWNGRCVPGEAFSASHCNQKLIGARYYNAGWGGNEGIDANLPWEFNSPRDYGGHGTHTATTAGGNEGVMPSGDFAGFGPMSGVAPRARIASYKVCWQTPTGGSCFSSDSVAAIDQAVADGVDVINFSISGSRTNFRDPVEIAFLFAADAGIFVAASAGNSGPASSTVAHPSPWLTTVANSTHTRSGAGGVLLGNGATYAGASFAAALSAKPLVDAATVALPGVSVADAERCFLAGDGSGQPTLDPAKVAGKIVLCKRGSNALVNKSQAVKDAGGLGAVIYNDPVGTSNTLALMHVIPTVHVVASSGLAIKSYIASVGASATAAILKSTIVNDLPAPITATTSSRGPLLAANGDLLKPDLIAPGTDVLAGVAPPGNNGRLFDLYSGTSMSSPHVAGLAALFKESRPGWSPMAIKSALMTTGYDVLDGGSPAPNTNPVLIFRQGAGHVDPNRALNPGVVFDSGWSDWLSFLCGAQPGGGCAGVTPMDPSDMNVPSIAIGDMAGTQTVQRRITNVSGAAATFTASYSGMVGFDVAITPSVLTLGAGETKPFTVRFTRTSATLNGYTGGQLTLSGAGTAARVPMVVRPVALAAPPSVVSNGSAVSYPVTFGFSGPFTATPRGLVPAAVKSGAVADDPTDSTCSLTSPNAQLIPVVVPAGTTYARFALFDADVSAGADIDLCVFAGTTLVGSSGSGTSAEEVNLIGPTAGTYTVVVQGWGVVGSSSFKLHTWVLGNDVAGNMTVSAPATATTGATGTIGLTFNGLTAGTKYLGSVAYGGVTGMPNPTIVTVSP